MLYYGLIADSLYATSNEYSVDRVRNESDCSNRYCVLRYNR